MKGGTTSAWRIKFKPTAWSSVPVTEDAEGGGHSVAELKKATKSEKRRCVHCCGACLLLILLLMLSPTFTLLLLGGDCRGDGYDHAREMATWINGPKTLPLAVLGDACFVLGKTPGFRHVCSGERLSWKRKHAVFHPLDGKVTTVNVAIVGGGIAGLAAAYTLADSNKNT